MNAYDKLKVLANASRFDLSCACGTKTNQDHRRKDNTGLWIYPVALPNGGTSIMLKTLLSNHCVNDCAYCPFRNNVDTRRCTLTPDETARLFIDYLRRLRLNGIFLSSGVVRNVDYTMDRLVAVAGILRRKYAYRGYIHLKIIPGASDVAIREALRFSSAVSLNVEAPTATTFKEMTRRKQYESDVVHPMKLISHLTAPGNEFSRVKQTTQFLVGAANENDRQLVTATNRLYGHLNLQRVFFSAYQKGQGEARLPGEQSSVSQLVLATREHRLYQTDWLLRKYGFSGDEIPFDHNGFLDLEEDPKCTWARLHPGFFPLDVNRAGKSQLLRVPGLGEVAVGRIMKLRKNGGKVRRLEDLGKLNKNLMKAVDYLTFPVRPYKQLTFHW